MRISYVAPIKDAAGYGEFARNIINSLDIAGHEIKITPLSFDTNQLNKGLLVEKAISLIGKHKNPDINIVNMIPRFFKQYKVPGAFNIGYTMFYGVKLTYNLADDCNGMDAILVPSSWNKNNFENSGVKVPLIEAPPSIIPEKKTDKAKSKFKYYSIFQWSERKNPAGLIRAYWAAHTGNTDVMLILKLYIKNNDINEIANINKYIIELKKQVLLRHYPEIQLITNTLSSEQMAQFNQEVDICVSPHRGEGWCMPAFSALNAGNGLIITDYSGSKDFANINNSWLLDYQMAPVFNMAHNSHYTGDMLWAEPNLEQLILAFRETYNNREKLALKSIIGQKEIQERFNPKIIGDRFNKIFENLGR